MLPINFKVFLLCLLVERKMRGFLVLIALFVVFSRGETAKEAHDKIEVCLKKCAKAPSVIRCQSTCKSSAVVHPQTKTKTKAKAERKIRPSKHPKKANHPPKVTTIKGRRVYLVRKN